MYAIRSYYEALVSTSKKDYNASSEALSGLVEDLTAVSEGYAENPPAVYADDEKWPETIYEALTIAVDSREKLLRITSYNVCYTKLLRCGGDKRRIPELFPDLWHLFEHSRILVKGVLLF